MLIPIQYLIQKYNMNVSGIIHVGANYGQEIRDYDNAGIRNIIWVEAIPEVYEVLCTNMQPYPFSKCFQACISNQDDQPVNFNITSNEGQSSSILNLKEHSQFYPNVVVTKQQQLRTITLDTMLCRAGIEISGNYNFLNMDIQGAELLALQGIQNKLHEFKYIYLEVNRRQLYEGCALESEI